MSRGGDLEPEGDEGLPTPLRDDSVEIEDDATDDPHPEEWDRAFDDNDAAYWADYFDRDIDDPDDWDSDDPEWNEWQSEAHQAEDDERTRIEEASREFQQLESRLITIIAWLSRSKYAEPIRYGFRVSSGHLVRLRSGERIDLVAWLQREGAGRIVRVGGILIESGVSGAPDPAPCITFKRRPSDQAGFREG
jgi:hypothetical protein